MRTRSAFSTPPPPWYPPSQSIPPQTLPINPKNTTSRKWKRGGQDRWYHSNWYDDHGQWGHAASNATWQCYGWSANDWVSQDQWNEGLEKNFSGEKIFAMFKETRVKRFLVILDSRSVDEFARNTPLEFPAAGFLFWLLAVKSSSPDLRKFHTHAETNLGEHADKARVEHEGDVVMFRQSTSSHAAQEPQVSWRGFWRMVINNRAWLSPKRGSHSGLIRDGATIPVNLD